MDKTLGELIQEALAEKGWSNAELARRTGFSPTHIGNLIRDYSPGTKSGKPTRLPADTVDRIANALGRPRDIFRRAAGLLPKGANNAEEQDESDRAAAAARTAEMIQNWMKMSPDEQVRALAVIKLYRGERREDREIQRPSTEVTDQEVERPTLQSTPTKPLRTPSATTRPPIMKRDRIDKAIEVTFAFTGKHPSDEDIQKVRETLEREEDENSNKSP